MYSFKNNLDVDGDAARLADITTNNLFNSIWTNWCNQAIPMKMFAFMGGNCIGKIKSDVKLFSVLVNEKSVAIAIHLKVHTTENLKQSRY